MCPSEPNNSNCPPTTNALYWGSALTWLLSIGPTTVRDISRDTFKWASSRAQGHTILSTAVVALSIALATPARTGGWFLSQVFTTRVQYWQLLVSPPPNSNCGEYLNNINCAVEQRLFPRYVLAATEEISLKVPICCQLLYIRAPQLGLLTVAEPNRWRRRDRRIRVETMSMTIITTTIISLLLLLSSPCLVVIVYVDGAQWLLPMDG